MNVPAWTVVLLWRVLERSSCLLDPHERDAVLGDIAEAKAGPLRALRDIGGLILRRQASIWLSIGPWLALVLVAIPVGVQLSHLSRGLADGNAIYALLYIDDWPWGFLDSPGARRDVARLAGTFLLSALTLGGCAWMSGYTLASISRRAVWATGALFVVMIFVGTVGTPSPARVHNRAVFAVPFYGIVFPRLIRFFCVVFPAAWGMWHGARPGSRPLAPLALAVAMLVALTSGVLRTGQVVLFGRADDLQRLVPMAIVMWPVLYVVASSAWRRGVPKAR